MGEQMGLNLGDRIHGHGNNNHQASAAKEERHRQPRYQHLRQNRDGDEINRTDNGETRQYIIEIRSRIGAGANTGNKAAMLLQVIRRILGVEDHRRIEKGG